MGVLLAFPSQGDRLRELLLESLKDVRFPSAAARSCAEERLTALADQYAVLPDATLSFTSLSFQSESDAATFEKELLDQFFVYVRTISQELFSKLVELEVRLCIVADSPC